MRRLHKNGEVLINRFEILDFFKSTELSRTFLALDRTNQKKVFIKCASGDQNDDKNSQIKIERLKIEAKILQLLNHPSIVRYVYSWSDHKDFYIATEYVEGKSLKEILANTIPASEHITEYLLQLLEITEYLHNRGIIHRDIKPANLLLSDNLVLLDFDAAEMTLPKMLHNESIIGTPGYQCPESFRGFISPQSDIYSIGATLLFMLTGQSPSGNLSRFRESSPHKDLLELAFKAMVPNPDKRYKTILEMKKNLLNIIKPHSKLVIGDSNYPILKTRVIIGRDINADFRIVDQLKFISPLHAEISRAENQFKITDKSINGTFIYRDGEYQKADQSKLSNGDIIALCYKPSKGPYRLIKFRQVIHD